MNNWQGNKPTKVTRKLNSSLHIYSEKQVQNYFSLVPSLNFVWQIFATSATIKKLKSFISPRIQSPVSQLLPISQQNFVFLFWSLHGESLLYFFKHLKEKKRTFCFKKIILFYRYWYEKRQKFSYLQANHFPPKLKFLDWSGLSANCDSFFRTFQDALAHCVPFKDDLFFWGVWK